ncbi:MAG: hypothetical protein NTV09_01700 [Bacteroidetes bacterium]|nr:hypothetical protein [Bacteroidota bacterium]
MKIFLKHLRLALSGALLSASISSSGQNVGIGTAIPLDKLHVVGNVRSTTLAGVGNRFVLADPNGTLIVGAAPGTTNPAWTILGNAGTVATTNFIGTVDANDFVVKTNGAAATNERIRVLSGGQIIQNRTTIQAGDVFSVYGNGYASSLNALGNSVINGYLNSPGISIYGENQDTALLSTAVYGIASTPGLGRASSIWADNTSATGYAIRAQATNAGGGIGVIGFTASQAALQGQASGLGDGLRAYNTSAAAGAGDAIFGYAFNGNAFSSSGVFGVNNSATGIGVLGGQAVGNIFALTIGQGGAFSGTKFGVTGWVGRDSLLGAGTSAGGYFYCNNAAFAYVGARIAGTNYKITGTGTAGTFVKDENNQYRIMACPEAPEILFQDYGVGELTNGMARIILDPIFSKNIIVSKEHPIKIFIQLETDCKGVFVSEKSATGFTVKELGGGSSNAKFAWSVVANRADETDGNGIVISKNADNRFVPAPPQEQFSAKPFNKPNMRIETPLPSPKPKSSSN